jgi:ribose transport system substrate-binding protein
MRKTTTYIFGLLIAIWLCGCNSNSSSQREVLVILKTLDNPYYQEMRSGILEQSGTSFPDVEIDIKTGAGEGDVSGQRAILDQYADRFIVPTAKSNLIGVIITPSSSGPELLPALSKFEANGIPVVVLDTKLGSKKDDLTKVYSAFRGSDNYLGGEIAGEQVRNHLPSGGKILLLNGVDGQETASARRDGFLSEFVNLSNYLIEQKTCNWNREEARTTVTGLLEGGDKFDFVFAANDEMALGAMEAKRQKGLAQTEMPIIGFDATSEARDAVSRHDLYATIAQKPAEMGKVGVEALSDLISGKQVERDISIPVELVK